MVETITPGEVVASKRTTILRKFGALMLAGAVVFGSVAASGVLTQTSASAATAAYGITIADTSTWVGSFTTSTGANAYCLEPGATNPDGPQLAANVTGTLPAYSNTGWAGGWSGTVSAPELSGEPIRYMNYIMSRYGQTNDANQAAAVQVAIWALRVNPGNQGWYDYQIQQLQNEGHGDVVTFANAMLAEAYAYATAGSMPTSPDMGVDGPYQGGITAYAGTTSLTLTNAIFVQTGTNTMTITDGQQHNNIRWVGQPPTAFDRYYTVTLDGTYSYSNTPATLIFHPSAGLEQNLGSPTPPDGGTGEFTRQAVDPDTQFMPELTSQVPTEFVNVGEEFGDTITLSASPAQDQWRWYIGTNNEVRYAPITATGTLYGPFVTPPVQSMTVPPGSPVAARATVTTTTEQGPGTYTVDSGVQSTEAGYYSWVWEIRWADQIEALRNPASGGSPIIPTNYYFTDGFGQPGETQVTPPNIEFSTQLSTNELAFGDSFTDNISTTLRNGAWLRGTDGERLEFRLRGSVYQSDTRPVESDEVPADANLIETLYTEINSPNMVFTSPEITPAFGTTGFVTVRWCLLDEDQTPEAAGMAVEFCDGYGVPSETAEILTPQVTTQAQPTGAVRDYIKDTAIVTGPVSQEINPEIQFTAYLKPEVGQPKYDENWEPVFAQGEPIVDEDGEPVLDEDGNPTYEQGEQQFWTEAEVADPAAVCKIQPVGTTTRVPVSDGAGEYESPGILTNSAGTIYWVEEYIVTNPENDEEVIIHEGICGLPNETTIVDYPQVTTQAVKDAFPGDEIFDTAIVTGNLSTREEVTYKVTFEAFQQTDKDEAAICTDSRRVFEDKEGVAVTEPGNYKSASYKVTDKNIGKINWVETLTMTEDETETVVHVGECGAETEITTVHVPPVPPVEPPANTPPGDLTTTNMGDMSPWLVAGLLGFAVVAVGSVMLVRPKNS